jgi:hypothetical protein
VRAAKVIIEAIVFVLVMWFVIVATIICCVTFPVWGPFFYSRSDYAYFNQAPRRKNFDWQ